MEVLDWDVKWMDVDPRTVAAITCKREEKKEKIIPKILLIFKRAISRSPLRQPNDWQWQLRNFIKIADTNEDGEVDDEDFVTFGGLLIQDVFNVLDTNDDGGIEAEIEGKIKSIPFSLVSKMIGRVFSYFDYNEDDKIYFVIGTHDSVREEMYLRNITEFYPLNQP